MKHHTLITFSPEGIYIPHSFYQANMGFVVYRCDECGKLILADGGAFLAHKKMRHGSRGYGKSKPLAVIESREKKYEFRDVPQHERERWIKANGKLRRVTVRGFDVKAYVV